MNIYLNHIKDACNQNKYTKWYIQLCQRALNRVEYTTKTKTRKVATLLVGYVEAHHIFPKCICENESDILDFNNIVFLTFREHIIAHLLLTKMFNSPFKYKLQHACNAFRFKLNKSQINENSKINSRTLELLKIEHANGMSSKRTGAIVSKETKEKMRTIAIEKRYIDNFRDENGEIISFERTVEFRSYMSQCRTGKGLGERNAMASEENRAKVGISKIGRKIAINPITKERKYVFPNNIPDGFILKCHH